MLAAPQDHRCTSILPLPEDQQQRNEWGCGELDLRGMLGLSDVAPVQLHKVRYVISVQGDGNREQYEAIHNRVKRFSPNYNAFINPVDLQSADLVILRESPEAPVEAAA